MVPCRGDVLDGIGNSGSTGGDGQGGCPALQGGDALLKDGGGRVHQAGVDIAGLRQAEAARGLGAVAEDVRRRGVDGDGSGVRRRVRVLLADVELQGLKFIILFHGVTSFLRMGRFLLFS